MLNQVNPRKVTTAFGLNGIPRYNIIAEDGQFGAQTTYAIDYLKNYFQSAAGGVSDPGNIVNFFNDFDNVSKLINQYPLLGEQIVEDPYNMIIDYKLLRGAALYLTTRYFSGTEAHSDADIKAGGRDGLFEIYTNVIASFIDQMIAAGEAYVNETTQWKHRDYGAGFPSTQDGGPGVSYGNGVKDSITSFTNKIITDPLYPNITEWEDYSYGHQPGLNSGEIALWKQDITIDGTTYKAYSADHPYQPLNWAGIDCNGFVQRIAKAAVYSDGTTIIPDRILPNMDNGPYYWTYDAHQTRFLVHHINILDSGPDRNIDAGNAYTIADDATDTESKWLHRGDFIVNPYHMVLVYEEPSHLDFSTDFQIINASGDPFKRINGSDIFTRKTIIFKLSDWRPGNDRTKINVSYGRFTLWEE